MRVKDSLSGGFAMGPNVLLGILPLNFLIEYFPFIATHQISHPLKQQAIYALDKHLFLLGFNVVFGR
jgi:hypothetical protein